MDLVKQALAELAKTNPDLARYALMQVEELVKVADDLIDSVMDGSPRHHYAKHLACLIEQPGVMYGSYTDSVDVCEVCVNALHCDECHDRHIEFWEKASTPLTKDDERERCECYCHEEGLWRGHYMHEDDGKKKEGETNDNE